MSNIETMFLIALGTDGSLTSYGEIPAELPEANRAANNFDVYQAAKQIVDDWESSMLVEKITRSVVAALQPSEPQSIPDAIKEKLKERGINAESVIPDA